MTLIVARKTGNEIRMYSDARISYPDQLHNTPLKGALKLITINDLCIGYAGNYNVALDTIRKIKKLKLLDYGQVIESLLKAHNESNNDVDFIIAVYRPALILIKISNGTVEMNLETAWIGDSEAFSKYQELYHSVIPVKSEDESKEKSKQHEVASKMSDALGQIVRDQLYESVGDFTISVRSSNEGFKYLGNAMVFPVSQEIPSGVTTKIKFGTAQQGGYAYSVLWSQSPNVGAIAVHFHQGNVGALYHPLEKDEAIVYPAVTFERFKKLVKDDYGFNIDGIKIS